MQNGHSPSGSLPFWYLGVTVIFVVTLGLL